MRWRGRGSVMWRGDTFGPRKPLMVLEDGRKVAYRTKVDDTGVLVAVYLGARRIGSMDAYPKSSRYMDDVTCASEIAALVAAHGLDGSFDTLVIHCAGLKAEYPELRRQGIGRAMYLALAAEWFDERKGQPFLFMPSACLYGRGSTSDKAMRVWTSLAKSLPSEGNVIAILERPATSRGRASTEPPRTYVIHRTCPKCGTKPVRDVRAASAALAGLEIKFKDSQCWCGSTGALQVKPKKWGLGSRRGWRRR